MMINVTFVGRRHHRWPRVAAVFGALMVAVLAAAMPSLAQTGAEWNVAQVGGPAAGNGVTIAVVDTGVDRGHPAFGGRVLRQLDCVGPGEGCVEADSRDPNGHGTHVAGTAAGGVLNCANAGSRAIGVAPQAQILPVRVLDADGSGTFEDVIEGIRRAADEGATVINLSLGDAGVPLPVLGSSSEEQFRQALADAWNKGSIPVLAAGNSRGDLLSIFRSGFQGMKAVVVTATDRNDNQPDYASSVARADWGIASPGGSGARGTDNNFQRDPNITSAWPNKQCSFLAGTSMATPHVSGALAVLRARGLSQEDAVQRVLDTATDLPGGWDGSGRLDLTAALQGLGGAGNHSGGSSTSAAPTTASSAPTTTEAPASTSPSTSPAPSSTTTSTTEAQESTTTERPSTTRESDGPADIDDEEVGSASILPDDGDDDGVGLLAAAAAVGACAFAWVLFGFGTIRLRT